MINDFFKLFTILIIFMLICIVYFNPDNSYLQKISNTDFSNVLDKSNIGCTIDDCFNFKVCPPNEKLTIFVLFQDDYKFMFNDLTKSIEIIDDEKNINQACLVVIFLKNANKNDYYKKIVQFLIKYDQNQLNNILLIDISNRLEETATKDTFINYLVSNINEEERDKVELNLGRSLFSSFSYLKNNFYDNLFVHFSVLNNETYFDEHESLNDFILNNQKIFEKRSYFISYNYNQVYSQYNNEKLNDINNIIRNSNVRSYIDPVCLISSNNLCYDLSKRASILLNSIFTLIIRDQDKLFWSGDLTYRLVESLRFSAIPVLVDFDLKLPLDELIKWDEIIIRIPISRANHIINILLEIDDSDIIKRQIKARSIYKSYFSSTSKQVWDFF